MSKYHFFRIVFISLFIYGNNLIYSQHQHPAINFDYNGLCYGSTTFFQNTTISNTPATYTWSVYRQGFANPIYTVASVNMTYMFPAKDTYSVLLCVDNGGGHSDCMEQEFVMDSVIHADFQYQDCESRFTSFSPCSNSQKWDFGDGNTSTLKNPQHYYTNTGAYNVKLVVSNGSQKDSIIKSIYSYTNIVTAGFTLRKIKDTVYFMAHDTTLGGNLTFHWVYGDGDEDEIFSFPGMKTKHVYPKIKKDSTYTAHLHVEAFCNEWETEQSIFIADSVLATQTILFPNPSHGMLYIESEKKGKLNSIKIYNSIGQEMTDFIIIDKLRGYNIDISTFSAGTYFVKIIFEGDEIKTYKIITH